MKMAQKQTLKLTPYDNLQFATETAWSSLVDRAIKDGLVPAENRPDGLMFMPSQSATQEFRNACKSVLLNLGANLGE